MRKRSDVFRGTMTKRDYAMAFGKPYKPITPKIEEKMNKEQATKYNPRKDPFAVSETQNIGIITYGKYRKARPKGRKIRYYNPYSKSWMGWEREAYFPNKGWILF